MRDAAYEVLADMSTKEMNQAVKMFEAILFELPADYKGEGVDFLEYGVEQLKKRIEDEG